MTAAERRDVVLTALGWSGRAVQRLPEQMLEKMTKLMSQPTSKPVPESTPPSVSETMPQIMSDTLRQSVQEPLPQSTVKPTPDVLLDTLPARHHLFAAALVFWRRHTAGPITAAHLGALLPERRSDLGVSRLAAPDPVLLSGEVTFDRRLAHQLAQLQCVLAQAGNVNALMGAPLEPMSPVRVFAGPLVYNAVTRLRKFGLQQAEEWMSGIGLEEWRRDMELLCRVVGVDPDLRPSRSARPAPTVIRSPATGPATGVAAGKAKVDGGGKDGGRSKAKRKARPQPQLTGNQFAALLQDSDDDAMSDDS